MYIFVFLGFSNQEEVLFWNTSSEWPNSIKHCVEIPRWNTGVGKGSDWSLWFSQLVLSDSIKLPSSEISQCSTAVISNTVHGFKVERNAAQHHLRAQSTEMKVGMALPHRDGKVLAQLYSLRNSWWFCRGQSFTQKCVSDYILPPCR